MGARNKLTPAVVGALGVVYGDIGTSPLYALRESLGAAADTADRHAEILGVLSLIFWSLFILVTLKYVVLLLRADNDGEGGILSLVALVQRQLGQAGPWARRVVALGVLGTALFYCDALLTPAVSVLSAVEGLELLDPHFHRAVLPVTIGIVIGLFAIQRSGVDRVSRLFGPIMLVWFIVLGVTGAAALLHEPGALVALDPRYGLSLLVIHPVVALVILGAVFLAVTGGEALYADMGHFGKRPVRIAWFGIVWPGLLLNYFGQGSILLKAQSPVPQPFFALVPTELLPVLIVLATVATIIASQATITGAFSITRQAVQLDLLPRVSIMQTSASARGQIYVPSVNLFMLASVLMLVVGFKTSSALAGAYGASVVGTMVITTVLGAIVARVYWTWSWWLVIAVFGSFFLVDIAFVLGNATKISSGGWVPLAMAAVMFFVFLTWRDGRTRLRTELMRRAVKMEELPRLTQDAARVPGTAIFLVSNPGFIPTALLRNLEHNHVCHERIVMLNLEVVRSPRHNRATRSWVEEIQPGVFAVRARFGFMETLDVSEALRGARQRGLPILSSDASYFLGWHLVRAQPRSGLAGIKLRLFAFMQRRSAQAAEFFRMPSHGVIILATDVEL